MKRPEAVPKRTGCSLGRYEMGKKDQGRMEGGEGIAGQNLLRAMGRPSRFLSAKKEQGKQRRKKMQWGSAINRKGEDQEQGEGKKR